VCMCVSRKNMLDLASYELCEAKFGYVWYFVVCIGHCDSPEIELYDLKVASDRIAQFCDLRIWCECGQLVCDV
jgi:hypothetical protein